MFEFDEKLINVAPSYKDISGITINGCSVSGSLVASSVDLDLINRAVSSDYRGYKDKDKDKEYDEDVRLMNTVFSKKLYKYLENLDLSCLIDNIVSEKISKLQDDLNLANCRVRFLEEDLKSLRSEIMSLRPEINCIKYQIESNNDV